MKFLKLITLTIVLAAAKAQACSQEKIDHNVLSAATTMERLNSETSPTNQAVYSLSSLKNTYAVIFYYDSLQNVVPQHVWQVELFDGSCLIKSVILQ